MGRLGRALVAAGLVLSTMPASAQTGCSVQSLAAVLAQFGDNVPYGGITPGNVRNLACSAMTVISQPGVTESVTVSPTVLIPSTHGTMVISSGKVELSRDFGTTWLQVGLVGGAVPVLGSDEVRVTWTGTAPTAVLLPQSP